MHPHAGAVNEARSSGLEVQSQSPVTAFGECITRVSSYILRNVLYVVIVHLRGLLNGSLEVDLSFDDAFDRPIFLRVGQFDFSPL